LHLTTEWREGAAVIFDRQRENQLMLESLDPDDSLRYAYYSRNMEFIGLARPLENCLTEDPIQVMLSGRIAAMRDAEACLRGAAFAEEFRLAVTSYERKDFAMIDVIPRGCSKGSSLAEWAALRGIAREEILAIGDNHNDLEMLTFAGIPVVMGNSVPELKTFGWHETGTNDENGVALAHRTLRAARGCPMRLKHGALFLLLAAFAAPSLRAEYVVLRNGQRLHVTGYQISGDKYRLQMSGGKVEVAAADVVAIEPEDVFKPVPAQPIVQPPYREIVEAAATRYKVDAALISSVIAVESNFDPKAVSRKNASGLMQLLPETAARLGVKDIFDPQENIDAGTRYLRELLQTYNNDVALALAAYNAGPEKVQLYGRVPPYAENNFLRSPRQARLRAEQIKSSRKKRRHPPPRSPRLPRRAPINLNKNSNSRKLPTQ